jgi:hypothetical protein
VHVHSFKLSRCQGKIIHSLHYALHYHFTSLLAKATEFLCLVCPRY